MSLYPEDLVMRSTNSIFHYACFSCNVCGVSLRQGDEYMHNNNGGQGHIVCKDHFHTAASANPPPAGVLLSVLEMTEIVADGAQGMYVLCTRSGGKKQTNRTLQIIAAKNNERYFYKRWPSHICMFHLVVC